MNDLAAYLAARNAETAAWLAEDPANRWASLLVEDLAVWAELGITTVEQFKRSMLVGEISDTYKDVYGFRPRMNFGAMSVAELESELAELRRSVQAEIERQDAEAAQAEAEIAALCGAQGIDRETYDRWMAEADQPVFV